MAVRILTLSLPSSAVGWCVLVAFTGGNIYYHLNRGSYMSAHVLLNLLNELRISDKVRGLPSILSLFCNKFNKFNNTGA